MKKLDNVVLVRPGVLIVLENNAYNVYKVYILMLLEYAKSAHLDVLNVPLMDLVYNIRKV